MRSRPCRAADPIRHANYTTLIAPPASRLRHSCRRARQQPARNAIGNGAQRIGGKMRIALRCPASACPSSFPRSKGCRRRSRRRWRSRGADRAAAGPRYLPPCRRLPMSSALVRNATACRHRSRAAGAPPGTRRGCRQLAAARQAGQALARRAELSSGRTCCRAAVSSRAPSRCQPS